MDTKVLAGMPLLVVGSIVLLWTSLSMKSVGDPTLALGAFAAIIMSAGSLLIGTSVDGRSV